MERIVRANNTLKMATIYLQREEKLAISVQKYPALYNKEEPSFHNKNEKANALSKIAVEFAVTG